MYSQADVRRLKLVKLARLLGLPLTEIRPLVEKAFVLDCSLFAAELTTVLTSRRPRSHGESRSSRPWTGSWTR